MKKILMFGLFLISSVSVEAQNENVKDKIKAHKIAFITQELNLTSDEATKFWPIYNEYETKKGVVQGKIRKLRSGKLNQSSDTQLVEYLKIRQEMVDIESAYIKKFKTAITSEKVLKLLTIEDEFREKLLNRVEKGMERRRGGQ